MRDIALAFSQLAGPDGQDAFATITVPFDAGIERIRDGYAEYFRSFDALITHVLPIPAHKHGVEDFVIDGQAVDATYLQRATVPPNVTGLPRISMRFGTSKEGLPINVQIVGSWLAEPTILHVASLLESVSSVRDLRDAEVPSAERYPLEARPAR